MIIETYSANETFCLGEKMGGKAHRTDLYLKR